MCLKSLTSTGMDKVKDEVKCGTDFAKDCKGVPGDIVDGCQVSKLEVD